jgi:predicted nucleic acid-binding protein
MIIYADRSGYQCTRFCTFEKKSSPGRILDFGLTDRLQIALDERIFDEYTQVLRRTRFQFPPQQVIAILSFIRLSSVWIEKQPTGMFESHVTDPGDLPFAEVAIYSHAPVIVTGNMKHYSFLLGYPVKVLSPQ